MSFRAFCLDRLRSRAKVPLRAPLFFLLCPFAENVLVLRVRLRKVVITKSLPKLQFAAAFAIALDDQLDAPLDFSGRTFPPAAEILIVLNFELANIPLELT